MNKKNENQEENIFNIRGEKSFFSPFDSQDGHNMTIIGAPGVGKTLFVKELTTSILDSGGKAWILDADASYEDLCEQLKGMFIDLGATGVNINPFSDLSDINDINGGYFYDVIAPLIELVAEMVSPDRPLASKYRKLLNQVLISTLKKYQSGTTFTHLARECRDILDENGNTIAEGEELAFMLFPFTNEGIYGKYFEGNSSIDLNNDFTVLGLWSLDKDPRLHSIVALASMIKINIKMCISNRKQKKVCIADEAWRIFGSNKSDEILDLCYRGGRKYGGSYIMSMQQKCQSEGIKAAFAHSNISVYFSQIKRSLTTENGFSEDEIKFLKGLKVVWGSYSELGINMNGSMKLYRFYIDPMNELENSIDEKDNNFEMSSFKNGVCLFELLREIRI